MIFVKNDRRQIVKNGRRQFLILYNRSIYTLRPKPKIPPADSPSFPWLRRVGLEVSQMV